MASHKWRSYKYALGTSQQTLMEISRKRISKRYPFNAEFCEHLYCSPVRINTRDVNNTIERNLPYRIQVFSPFRQRNKNDRSIIEHHRTSAIGENWIKIKEKQHNYRWLDDDNKYTSLIDFIYFQYLFLIGFIKMIQRTSVNSIIL